MLDYGFVKWFKSINEKLNINFYDHYEKSHRQDSRPVSPELKSSRLAIPNQDKRVDPFIVKNDIGKLFFNQNIY